jgi:hypothetical protein
MQARPWGTGGRSASAACGSITSLAGRAVQIRPRLPTLPWRAGSRAWVPPTTRPAAPGLQGHDTTAMRHLVCLLPLAALSGCLVVVGPAAPEAASALPGGTAQPAPPVVEASQAFGLAFELEADRPLCVHDLAWRIDGVQTKAPAPWHRQFCTRPEQRHGRTVHVASLALGVALPAQVDQLTVHFRRHPAAPLRMAEFALGPKLQYKPGWRTESLAVVLTADEVKLDRLAVRTTEGSSMRSTVRERIDVQGTRRDGAF